VYLSSGRKAGSHYCKSCCLVWRWSSIC